MVVVFAEISDEPSSLFLGMDLFFFCDLISNIVSIVELRRGIIGKISKIKPSLISPKKVI